ncbi:unnamed protein product [Camellia sinensis]
MQPAPQDLNKPNGVPVDGPSQGVINVIHGIVEPERVCELRGMIKKAEHLREVLSAQPIVKKERTVAANAITFLDRDLARLHCPHNDALVVTLRVKNFNVKRILIDQGSSCEIMCYETFKQLKLKDKDLAPATSPLIGFNSMPKCPVGKIILLVKAGTMTKQVEFWVLKVPSTYNIILGRTWLHAMCSVASTYHQALWFPNETGMIEEVLRDQIMSKQCFVIANDSRVAKGFVQMVEEPESKELFANVGKAAEQKVVEDLVEVRIDKKNPEKFFLFCWVILLEF